MKAIVATATNPQEALEVLNAIYAREPFIIWADMNTKTLQVTAIYEPQIEVQERQEQEYQQAINEIEAASKPQPKKQKQPNSRELNAKTEKLCLFDIEVDKSNGIYTISKIYGGKVLFTSTSGIAVSRRLTKIYWDKMIAATSNDQPSPSDAPKPANDKKLDAIFKGRAKQKEQFLIIKKELISIGIKFGKMIANRDDAKGWTVTWDKVKAGLYWTVGQGWGVEPLKSGDELKGQWREFDLDQQLECNGHALDEYEDD